MLNLIDILRCFIHQRGYSKHCVTLVDNQTGFLECLISENRLVKALPLIDLALNNLVEENTTLPIVISRSRSSLRVSFKGQVIICFDREVVYRQPFPVSTKLFQSNAFLGSIDDIQRYSDYRIGNSR